MRLSTVQADAICDSSFTSAFSWNRNGKGNLWRRWRGKVLTIFQRGPFWLWSIREPHGGVIFGSRAHATEGDAMNELLNIVRNS